jgi:PadR family transcriptional regulator, regulatory protein PadR
MNEPILEFKGFLSFLILHELSKNNLCGDELAHKIGKRRGVVLTPGTIYPALIELRKRKVIKFSQDGRKKFYYLTEEGKNLLEEQYNMFSNYFWGLKGIISKKRLRKSTIDIKKSL